jgi:hypothetical protein
MPGAGFGVPLQEDACYQQRSGSDQQDRYGCGHPLLQCRGS